MSNCIVVVQYNTLVSHPPTMSLLLALRSLGREIYLISIDDPASRRFVESNDIPATLFPSRWLPKHPKNKLMWAIGAMQRALHFYFKRAAVRHVLSRLSLKYNELMLWFQEVNSAALLGNACFKYPKRALTLFEINDVYGKKWWGFNFNKFMNSTTVVVPEYNRAFIVECMYRLKNLPLVLTNKPANHPRQSHVPTSNEVSRMFAKIGERPIFLYQGVWGGDRADVGYILEVIARHRPQYAVLVMPGTEEVNRRLGACPNAYTLPYMPAPEHLAVTSRVTVGIAVYGGGEDPLYRLNALYCAPNKIYEYAGFGVPTLGNNIPGLKYTIEANGAGVCCELTEESILESADELICNIEKYRKGALAFFNKVDTNREVAIVLKKLEEDV